MKRHSIALLVLFCLFAPLARAAAWPAKPITVVVPFGAGGNADIMARLVCKAAEEYLGQPLVISNKPGGGTIPGVTEAIKARPDGYTMVWIALPSVVTQPYLKKTPYSMKDLTPIANVSWSSLVLYVRDDSPWYTLQQFLDAAKEKPLSVGMNGIGALPHLAAVELAQKSGAAFKYVASETSVTAVMQLLGGHIDAALAHHPQAFSHGKGMRALAVFDRERSRKLPLVPTAVEQGYEVVGYVRDGIAVPSKAPDETKKILEEAFRKAMATAQIDADFRNRDIEKLYLDSAESQKMWMEADAHYRKIIAGMK